MIIHRIPGLIRNRRRPRRLSHTRRRARTRFPQTEPLERGRDKKPGEEAAPGGNLPRRGQKTHPGHSHVTARWNIMSPRLEMR